MGPKRTTPKSTKRKSEASDSKENSGRKKEPSSWIRMQDADGHWGSYKGALKNELMDGEGQMLYDSKDLYSGEWKNGCKIGPGNMVCRKSFIAAEILRINNHSLIKPNTINRDRWFMDAL